MSVQSVRTPGVGAVAGPKPKLTGRAGLLIVTVMLLALVGAGSVGQYLDQRSKISELEREVQRLEQANAELSVEIAGLRDPAALERLARECLGMVRPGEVALVTDGPGAASPDC